ncbi:MAG: exodeoxyribonuclease VII large subunit [Myroides sp.]|jgi:exodeoxyribonuclease VII large subunit|nr:exodeoxyribonuclease VII large subunit [Myroides sp.]
MNVEYKYHRLSNILSRVKTLVDEAISNHYFWLKVEIAQIREDRKGHIYLELVDNEEGVVLARSRANIWQTNARAIKNTLGNNADDILKEGSEILCYCEVTYSILYGMSINIVQIDLSYSLGEVERIKQENLNKLIKLGYTDLNKQLTIPLVLQRIALVSSENTAGHADFMKQLQVNENNFQFAIDHYNCQVQGDNAVPSILGALASIPANTYDIVVIIRGGGSALDLDVFNNYELAVTIASCHTPVFSGIGHETDSTLADYVAAFFFKTPSAVAAYIVERTTQYYVYVCQTYDNILQLYKNRVREENHFIEVSEREIRLYGLAHSKQKKEDLHTLSNRLITEVRKHINREESFIEGATQSVSYRAQRITHKEKQTINEKARLVTFLAQQSIEVHKHKLSTSLERLVYQTKGRIKREQIKLSTYEEITTAYDLSAILRKGFAIVMHNGQLLNEDSTLVIGDELEIAVYNKKYIIKLAEIKEVNQWNNLLTKKQH